MKITVFTSNQSRHLSLINSLAGIADQVYAIQECSTIFPGEVEDFFHRSDVMQAYFKRVISAERDVFGAVGFTPGNVRQLSLRMGDLSRVSLDTLADALDSDVYVVFGASYIRGALINYLVARGAINIHMGVSPYYRGSSCNFWALYDGRPEYVGATIHKLSKGLDSGDMLFHVFPKKGSSDPFVHGMMAVKSAHDGLCYHLQNNSLSSMPSVKQRKDEELRYTRNADFTDEVAQQYLCNLPSSEQLQSALKKRDLKKFLNPLLV
ncbi:MAG: methionyl-tRNA formyltransferase [Gammaproteobacteria bacterium]|nr:methionyl-tRNA formyltransferase [Gammaproteobacteria bacterium]MBU0801607.1 methionyl-tRNA formyltransferase [Alphaproteobacteria bacterium]MBU1804123.1 methionyl-tRNA formyltransferase [Gammaproteobacteria bacterium]